ncbi:MAG: hypothetical protein IKL25_02165 [Clostridia bacterium]|nr:hypothetical protein [Clostridia bacterium]
MQDDFNNWQPNMTPEHSAPRQPDMPMKWHKFLIYFSLWAGGILNAVSGFNHLTGNVYGDEAAMVYNYFESLKGVDMIYGLALIALGVFQIFTRFQLAGFKRNGPSILVISYVAVLAASVLYGVIVGGIIDVSLLDAINPTSIGISIAMIICNKVYYDKRAHMFVN